MWFFSRFKLTPLEIATVERADAPASAVPAFLEDVRTKMSELKIRDSFERHLTRFEKHFGESLVVGHIYVCAHRACQENGIDYGSIDHF